jgi:hypothetical protein
MFFPEHVGSPQDGPFTIMIEDPVAGVIYNLEVQNHTAQPLDIHHSLLAQPPNGSPIPPPPPPIKPPLDQVRPKATSEDLGTQIIDGMEAHGRRVTRTFPPGSQGNDGPIVVTEETWNCPELDMIILSKTSDPRSGETITRITDLDRSEPDLSLFQVPPDYTIVDHGKN